MTKKMISKSVITILVLVLVASFLVVNSLDGSAADYNLSLAFFAPSTHPLSEELLKPWADKIERATDGQVEITFYFGETLLKANNTYEGVVSGIADLGLCDFGYNPRRFPLLNALFVGGLEYEGSKVASYVAKDFIEEFDPESLHDTKLMFVYTTAPGAVMTKSPVRTLENLKGLQLKCTGQGVNNLDALGATPIAMPMSDTYEALSKGVIDGLLTGPEVLEGWNMTEVVDYITMAPFMYNAVHYVTMNKDVWESMPAELQQTIDEVNTEFFAETASSIYGRLNQEGIDFGLENGDELIELSESEQKRWIEGLQVVQEDYIETLNKDGYDGEKVMSRIKELIEKYNKQFD